MYISYTFLIFDLDRYTDLRLPLDVTSRDQTRLALTMDLYESSLSVDQIHGFHWRIPFHDQ